MRLYCNLILVVSLLAVTSIAGRSGAEQAGGNGLQRPNLELLHSETLTHALETPETLWTFLTDPNTPYTERMAAAVQGKKAFAISLLSRLTITRQELAKEEAIHHWGLKPSPHSAIGSFGNEFQPAVKRKRLILGHVWMVPNPLVFQPDNWQEEQTAPWPWQVSGALNELMNQVKPNYYGTGDLAYIEAWYAEAFKWPCNTDEEAQRFVGTTGYPLFYKNLHVLTRWRQIAMDPRFPNAAREVASAITNAMYSWGDPRAQGIGQAIICDILNQNQFPQARFEVAWRSPELKRRFTGIGDQNLPTPMAVVVALGDAAMNLQYGTEWERLYDFVVPVCQMIPDAPIKGDIVHMRPDSTEAKTAMKTFCEWFPAHRGEFAGIGAEQLRACPAIAAIRGEK